MTNNSSTDCIGNWSPCSVNCGCGTKTYTITTQKTGDGKYCETTNGKKENCNTDVCPLDCNLIQNKIQTYYNTEGKWKGIYTMEPITTNKVSNNECDVKYKYNPVLVVLKKIQEKI